MGAHRQLVSASQGEPVYDGDHGKGEVLEFREDGDVLRGKAPDRPGGFAEELGDIGSRDECPSRPRQNQRPHLPPLERAEGTKLPHGRGQLGKEVLVERIQRLRSVKNRDRHVAQKPQVEKPVRFRVGASYPLAEERILVLPDRPPGPVRLDERDAFRFPHGAVQHFLLDSGKAGKGGDLEVLLFHDDLPLGEKTDHFRRLVRPVHVGSENGQVRLPPEDHVPAWHRVLLVMVAQDEGAEVEGALVRALHDEIGALPGAEDSPAGLAESLGVAHEFRGVSGVRLPVGRERVGHILRQAQTVPVDHAGRGDAQSPQRGDSLLVGRAGGDESEFRPPRQCGPGKGAGVRVGAPDQSPAAWGETDFREDRIGGRGAEEDLLLTHPDPTRVEDEPSSVVEKRFLVLPLESLPRGAEEGERSVVRQGGDEQGEALRAGVLEYLVDRPAAVRGVHCLAERFRPCMPLVVAGAESDGSEHLRRYGASVHEGVRESALDERPGESGVGPHQDHPGPELLGDLRPRETCSLPPPHEENAVSRRHPESFHYGPVRGPIGKKHRGKPFRRVGAQGRREGDRPLFVHDRELGVEPVMGFVPADIVPGPRIEDDRLPYLDPRYRGAGVDDYAEGIAPRDVNGCGVAPAEHRHREAQRCEVGVEVRPRGQDRHEDTFCVAAVKAGDRNPLQPESSGGRAVSVPVNQKRVHRFGEGCAEGRLGREGPQSAVFGSGSGHDSSMRALLRFRNVVPDGISLWIPKTIA